MTTPSQAVRAYLAEIGRKGGRVKVATKGFASLSKRELKELSKKAAEARWGKKK